MVDRKDIAENALVIGLVVAMLSFLGIGIAQMIASFPVPNTGTMKVVGIAAYWINDTTTPQITTFDWSSLVGPLSPSDNIILNIWIYNNGTVPVDLSHTITGWNPPELSQYFTITWNGDGQTLNPKNWIETEYTLTVSADIPNTITTFNFLTTFLGTSTE